MEKSFFILSEYNPVKYDPGIRLIKDGDRSIIICCGIGNDIGGSSSCMIITNKNMDGEDCVYIPRHYIYSNSNKVNAFNAYDLYTRWLIDADTEWLIDEDTDYPHLLCPDNRQVSKWFNKMEQRYGKFLLDYVPRNKNLKKIGNIREGLYA